MVLLYCCEWKFNNFFAQKNLRGTHYVTQNDALYVQQTPGIKFVKWVNWRDSPIIDQSTLLSPLPRSTAPPPMSVALPPSSVAPFPLLSMSVPSPEPMEGVAGVGVDTVAHL